MKSAKRSHRKYFNRNYPVLWTLESAFDQSVSRNVLSSRNIWKILDHALAETAVGSTAHCTMYFTCRPHESRIHCVIFLGSKFGPGSKVYLSTYIHVTVIDNGHVML